MQPQRTAFTLLAIKADVSDEEQVISMFQQAIQEFGTIDILVAMPDCSGTLPSTR